MAIFSVQKPGVVSTEVSSVIRSAVRPVSSSSSRTAQSSGSSSARSSLPAGISSVTRSTLTRCWRTSSVVPSSYTGTTAAAPLCTTISRGALWPLGQVTCHFST